MTEHDLIASCADAVKAFQAFRDQYSDEAWDQLQDKPHTENLLDALTELEFQLECTSAQEAA
jgi:uncharacterized protein YeaO (DUF488 family)